MSFFQPCFILEAKAGTPPSQLVLETLGPLQAGGVQVRVFILTVTGGSLPDLSVRGGHADPAKEVSDLAGASPREKETHSETRAFGGRGRYTPRIKMNRRTSQGVPKGGYGSLACAPAR